MKSKLINERRSLIKEINALKREKELLRNKIMLEDSVRKELGYIKPGEIIFELKKENPKQK